jgi:hypothetical protein
MRQHRTRNLDVLGLVKSSQLEIPNSRLATRPGMTALFRTIHSTNAAIPKRRRAIVHSASPGMQVRQTSGRTA